MIVFVYGTLKSGYGNNRLLAGTTFIGEAVAQDIKLYHAGFPVAREVEGERSVGELWDIGEDQRVLRSLDSLEGEGRMYNRRGIVTETLDGIPHVANAYIGHPEFWEFADGPASPVKRDMWARAPIQPCPVDDQGRYVWGR